MAGQGWVSVYRELLEKSIWLESTPEQKTILITLLLMANHAPKKWEWKGASYEVQPGQFVTSLDSIAKKAGKQISVKNVRTAIARFEKLEFLANESTNKNRLITINNWGFYQSDEGRYGKQTGKQSASDRQVTGKRPATNNNVNNDNNVNKNTSSNQDLKDHFDSIWKLYPNKKGKDKAYKAYCKAIKEKVSDEIIIDGINRYKKEIQIKQTEKQYIAHGSTWFSQQRWQDDYLTQSFDSTASNGSISNMHEIDDLGWDD